MLQCTKIREQAVAEEGTPSISGSENVDHLMQKGPALGRAFKAFRSKSVRVRRRGGPA
jgi:hypothetical protein